MKIQGCASLNCLRRCVTYKLCKVDDNNSDDSLDGVVQQIVDEVRKIPKDMTMIYFNL